MSSRRRRLTFVGVPLAAALLVLGACSSGVNNNGGTGDNAGSGATSGATAAATAAATTDSSSDVKAADASTNTAKAVGPCVFGQAKPASGTTIATGAPITVAIVPKLLGLSVFEANVKGAKQVAPDLNETINYTASVQANASDQAQVIQGLINSNNPPDVIAYSANDPTTIVPVLQQAMAKGIHVIGFDSDVTASGREYFIQNTDYAEFGKSMVDLAVKEYGDKGTIGIVSTTTDATIQNAWINAITSYAKTAYPDLKFPIVYGQSNAAQSQTQTVNLLNSNPDTIAIFALDSSAGPGALAALKAQGLGGKIGVWAVSTPSANKQYFEDGSINGLWMWDEVGEGQLIAYLARGVCDNTIPAAGGTFTAGPLGQFTVQTTPDVPADMTIIFSKTLLIDKNNYTQYDF